MSKTIYIPCRANIDVLNNAIQTLIGQVDKFVIFNNTNEPMNLGYDNVEIVDPPDPLLYGQSLNAAVKMARKEGTPYCLWAHSDILVQPGAVDALFEKYEEVKDSKWGVIWTNYDSLCLFNPVFFIDEGVYDDVILFSQYHGDNHRARIMQLRGYGMYIADKASPLVNHLGSHTIKMNPTYNMRNQFAFNRGAQLYRELWGGDPGREVNTDPTCHGIYPI